MSPPRRIKRGEELIRQGSSPHASTLLLRGLAGRVTWLAKGARQITAIHVEGDFFDLHSFLLPVMDHAVVALSDGEVSTINHGRLQELTEQFPHLCRSLWLSTLLDGAIHRRWLVAAAGQDAVSRTAHLFCELFVRLQVVGQTEGHTFSLPLTQTTLADVIGLSYVHLNRCLQQLRTLELVRWGRGQVEVLDWQRLATVAEFDPTYLVLNPVPL